MSSGSAGACAATSCQGAFTGQFDSDMGDCQLIRWKTKLRQFYLFQQVLSNAVAKFCAKFLVDTKELINEIEEDNMNQPEMLSETLTESKQGPIHMSNYDRDMKDWKEHLKYYKSNKSAMCSVVLMQCDPAMQVRLQIMEDRNAKS